jgi:leucyl aminopeptidase
LEAREAILGSMLAHYRFTRYMSNTKGGEARIHYVGCSGADFGNAASQAEAVRLARDLGNEPAGSLSPARFVEAVKQRFSALPVEIEVLEESELESKGFGGIIGVGKGSVNPPTPPSGQICW